MPTLLQRVGPDLAQALSRLLIQCRIHGPSPWIPVCRCVLEGAPAAEVTPGYILCDDHARMSEAGEPGGDEDVDTVCRTCMVDRGILL